MMTRGSFLCNNLKRNTLKGNPKYIYLNSESRQGLDSEPRAATIHFSDDVCGRFGPLDPRTTSAYRVGIKSASGLAV